MDQITSIGTLLLLRLISIKYSLRLCWKYYTKVLLLFYEIHIILNISKSSRLPKISINVVIATSCTQIPCMRINIVIFPYKIVIFLNTFKSFSY